jgi:Protein of unknown function (DUF3151)
VTGDNLLGVPETRLPADPAVTEALDQAAKSGADLASVAAAHPSSSLAWALLADAANVSGNYVESYAYARVGYHRGLDALRKAGWRGQGPIPWAHEPNRGVLRSLYALRRAAAAIGENDEVERLGRFLEDSDPTAVSAIEQASVQTTLPTEAIVIRGDE